MDGSIWQYNLEWVRDQAHVVEGLVRLGDHAKARTREKRGGERRRVALSVADVAESWNLEETVSLDEAIRRLEDVNPTISDVVRLRFFGGLSISDTAHALGVSKATVKRRWEFGRTWLFRELK